ncbi:Inosine-5'-monophosphate dehydrogenase, partial [Tetrabaena socialis]
MGGVEAVMRTASQGIFTTSPDVTLQSIIPLLNKVTGLPVLDSEGVIVGVISRKDIIRVRKSGGTLSEKVRKHMTSPALTVPLRATVQEAADVMLQYGIRRIPVVDETGHPVGLVSRSDIFKPLGDYTRVMAEELEMLAGKGSWQIK